ncbi:MAG: hypothetical protein ACR2O1_12445 [Boseongicola sp.]
MKPMISAFAAIFLIGVAAYFILGGFGFSSEERAAGDAVRLDTSE